MVTTIATSTAAPFGQAGGRKVTAKALRRALKKAGLKTTGRKSALTRRAKKAHLKVGGGANEVMGGRRRSRRHRGGEEEGAAPEEDDLSKGGPFKAPGSPYDGGRRRRKSRGFRLF
jgi:hypothetical protein